MLENPRGLSYSPCHGFQICGLSLEANFCLYIVSVGGEVSASVSAVCAALGLALDRLGDVPLSSPSQSVGQEGSAGLLLMSAKAAAGKVRSALVSQQLSYWGCSSPPPSGSCCAYTPLWIFTLQSCTPGIGSWLLGLSARQRE